ncbi:hypothetical protein BVI2075_970016 [Burkholderia vietnamiensis]|nr:hypothetical protein BVI2075_970016 [Burkholderia vietnamiensis]
MAVRVRPGKYLPLHFGATHWRSMRARPSIIESSFPMELIPSCIRNTSGVNRAGRQWPGR